MSSEMAKVFEVAGTDLHITLPLTPDDIGDILTTAFEGGVTYWADQTRTAREAPGTLCAYAHETVRHGGSVELHDSVERVWVGPLDLWRMVAGIEMYAQRHPERSLDPCDIDADEADLMVQYALFGEAVYG